MYSDFQHNISKQLINQLKNHPVKLNHVAQGWVLCIDIKINTRNSFKLKGRRWFFKLFKIFGSVVLMTHGELEVQTATVRKVFVCIIAEKYVFGDAHNP